MNFRNIKYLVPLALAFTIVIIALVLIVKVVIGFSARPTVARIFGLPIPVYGYRVSYKESQNFLGANADTEGYKVIPVMAPETGISEAMKVLRIPVNIGKKVRKGETLAVLDSFQLNLDMEFNVKKIKADRDELEYLRDNYSETKKGLLAKSENIQQELKGLEKTLVEKRDILSKMLGLFEKRYIGLLELEGVKDEVRGLEEKIADLQTESLDTRHSMLEIENKYKETEFSLRSEISSLERDLKRINTMTDSLRVRSPIEGYVTDRVINENGEVFPRAKILEVSLISPLKILPHISHIYLDNIQKGQEVNFRFSESGKEYKGTVSAIYPTVERKTQTFVVEILFDNKNGDIMPGTASFVRFFNLNKKIVLIPKFAVAGLPDAPTVFVIKDNKATARRVALGERYPFGMVEIKEGLESGDIVIKSSLKYINDGKKVKLAGTEG